VADAADQSSKVELVGGIELQLGPVATALLKRERGPGGGEPNV
jgi:hypothetical protein